jgi:glycosyltransferase involved in cell wall biosynthesis
VDCVVANRAPQTRRETRHGARIHRLASFGSAFSVSLCPAYPFSPRRFHADLWHAHFPNPLADLAAVLGPRHVPLVLHWHSDIIRQRAVMAAYRPLQTALLRRADRIVVATPLHLEHSAHLGPWREKVEVIPFGLDLKRFEPTPALAGRVEAFRREAHGKPIFLNLGRLVGYKGQRHAIEALRTVDAVLWLVGTGPLEAELRRVAAEAGVTDRVRFWGDVPDMDLPVLLHACEAFVFPSVTPNEAFGLVLVEAMACGKPVIACDLKSGVPYVCRHGENGLIVPPADAKALAAAMNLLLQSVELRTKLGAAGRRRAQTEFAVGTMIRRHLDLFAQLLRPCSA